MSQSVIFDAAAIAAFTTALYQAQNHLADAADGEEGAIEEAAAAVDWVFAEFQDAAKGLGRTEPPDSDSVD